MNQIIQTNGKNVTIEKEEPILKKKKSFLKIQLISSAVIVFLAASVYFYLSYSSMQKEKLSKKLLNNFSLTTLYSNSMDYTTTKLNSEIENSYRNIPNVIGLIEIPKINITYTILSKVSDELLKLSPCRFYGPFPNMIGNLCIARS